ncbi:MAG TPA: molybdopterin-dependent oxidoreductase [Candidatus Acidoferrales bacterium]|nr:molybdopterin-dependent oxidoreductase [Candidatus Acidoferrales bacterium]
MDERANRPKMRTGLVLKFPRKAHQLTESITPLDGIFTLAHFGIPDIDPNGPPSGWTIEVDGMVSRPIRLTLDDLMRRPKRTVRSVHECAGNPLKPKQAVRAIANLVWGGADLREILDEAGINPAACFIWSYGVDHGEFGGLRCESYLKDLPLERVAAGDVILAYEMNGEPLTVEHGAPVRLFIPGYYGTNSVKWLCRMTIADRRADGPLTTVLYNDPPPRSRSAGRDSALRPVWEIAPESIIVAPAPGSEIRAKEPIEIWGWTWAARGVARVEVSTDGGATYARANLAARQGWSWQKFTYQWKPDVAGTVTLASRATDYEGVTQPPSGARNSIYKVGVCVKR